jgi:hypothetical protein
MIGIAHICRAVSALRIGSPSINPVIKKILSTGMVWKCLSLILEAVVTKVAPIQKKIADRVSDRNPQLTKK